jgi:hypothetical protein
MEMVEVGLVIINGCGLEVAPPGFVTTTCAVLAVATSEG